MATAAGRDLTETRTISSHLLALSLFSGYRWLYFYLPFISGPRITITI